MICSEEFLASDQSGSRIGLCKGGRDMENLLVNEYEEIYNVDDSLALHSKNNNM